MKLTTNYGLKKPEGTDTVNIDDLNDNADIVDAKLKALDTEVTETKKSASDGKSLLAAAITLQGVATAATDTFAKMASNIKAIITGSGNATPPDVLAGRTFTNSTGVEQAGTMPDKVGTTTAATASLDTANSRIQLAIPATGKYDTAAKLYAAYATIANLIGLTAAKLWPGNTVLGITSSNSSVAGGTYTPGAADITLNHTGKVLTSAIIIKGRPAGWYDSATQQTVFNFGSYGNAANMGAFYTNSLSSWMANSANPAVMNEDGAMYMGGTNPTVRVIFRQAFPAEWKWMYIKWFTAVSNRSITVFVIDPNTMLSIGNRSYTITSPSTEGNSAFIDLSQYVSQLSNGWFLGIGGDFSNMSTYGLRTVILGPSQPVP